MRAVPLFLLLLLLCVPARAQGVDQVLASLSLSPLADWADQAECQIDVPDMLGKLARGEAAWDWEQTKAALKQAALSQLDGAMRLIVLLVIPAALGAILTALRPDSGAAAAARLVCTLALATQLLAAYTRCALVATQTLSRIGALTQRIYPILAALLAAAGSPAGAALFTPIAAMVGTLVASGLNTFALTSASVTAAVTIAGHLSEKLRLDALFGLLRKLYAFALGAAMTLFTAVMAVQGALSRGYDGASIQTARFAVGSLLPIVGGEVADSIDALLTSAALVKSALGVTGLLLLSAACLSPLLQIGAYLIAVRLASALVEPIGAGPAQKLLERFAEVLGMLLAAVAAGMVLLIVVIGAAIAVFGGG
ncbi:MAG: hypothetical protein RSC06_15100 [Clostridia bacterium]